MSMKALAGLLRKEVYHILRDRRTLTVIIAAAGPAGDHLRLRDPHRRRSRAAGDRRPGAGPGDAGAAQPVRRGRRVPRPSRVVPRRRRCSSRCSGAAPRRGRCVFEPGFAEQPRPRPAGATADHHRRHRAEYRAASSQAYALRSSRATSARLRAARPGAVRIVPEVRMRFNPTRESSNLFVPGLMAFVLTIISSLMTAISLTREKETGHDGGAARLAAAAVADHRRQGGAVPRGRLRQRASA